VQEASPGADLSGGGIRGRETAPTRTSANRKPETSQQNPLIPAGHARLIHYNEAIPQTHSAHRRQSTLRI